MLIEDSTPDGWRDLQAQVNRILNEVGMNSEVEKSIDTVRGSVVVDVFAQDTGTQPQTTYICECKHWKSRVPKTVVHSLNTVVNNYGANWGFIISSAGFQSGAFEAAQRTNIKLRTWAEFQELFSQRWMKNYMEPRLRKEVVDPLFHLTEPIVGSRVNRLADSIENFQWKTFFELNRKYAPLTFLALSQVQNLIPENY